ncbi:tetratricopeptide repeat protein [Marinobacter salinisoli]|uniref:Tetratricopeptide repeat protein n=1 Tax=Marinobacter salinisoli TaxID=2769486 RepID=A0ABX7MSE0_9GAMM|nr:tetratricopeptide repeat protein [Marinobacter salinisoli]QSP95108.1 tetratricopeptide repeat protein [Marinobacter salinisoli]
MAFVKSVRAGALMSAVLLSGCAGLGTMTGPEPAPETAEKQVVESAPVVVPDVQGEADSHRYLPQQGYDAAGNKIDYAAEPNPYTQASAPVAPEVVARFQAASKLMAEEKNRMARKAFEAITRDYPELSGPWVKLGELAEIGERLERAEKSYRKAIEVNPDNVNAYLALALLQRRNGDFEASRDTYVAALELWKDYPEAHLNLAILYDLYMNQPVNAQPHFEAYQFLVQGDHPQVADWLIEIRRRTGIETSFIDNPPAKPEPAADDAAAEPVAADAVSNEEPVEEKG